MVDAVGTVLCLRPRRVISLRGALVQAKKDIVEETVVH